MNKTLVTVVLSLALCTGTALTVLSQANPEAMVKQRQAAMTLLGKYYGPLAAMADGKAQLSADVVARNAGYLDVLSTMPWDGFGANTAGEKSRALPTVYSDPAKFKSAGDELRSAAAKLLTIAKSKDAAAIKSAVGTVGESCGGCHKAFRRPS